MERKRVIGKLLVVGGGTGVLALAIFVLLPWLTQPAESPQQMARQEIVQEVLSTPSAEEGLSAAYDEESGPLGKVDEGAAQVLSPIVGFRDNGEEVAVVFQVAAGEPAEGEAIGAGENPVGVNREEGLAGTAEVLPPALSPEEVAVAIEGLDGGGQEDTGTLAADEAQGLEAEGARVAEAVEPSRTQPSDPVRAAQAERWQPEVVLVRDGDDVGHVEVSLPPPSATREVQELLEALGYAPGPADGIWGKHTEKAWSNFARDAAELAVRKEPPEPQPGEASAPSARRMPAPSGDTLEPEGQGAEQAGLPLTQPPVVVPENLRGVMGYRMPLVSRQGVPDQVVSGVLIPAHTTFVILKPGYWELVGLEPGEVERLREADERESMPASEADKQPVKRVWNPLRLFRKQGPHANGG